MSWVTNLILYMGDEDDHDEKLVMVNRFFDAYQIRGFVSVENPDLPNHWYGGNQYLEAKLYLGAFNHLHLQAILEHLKKIEWDKPEWVQLFVMEQEDAIFRIINIAEARKEPPWVDLDQVERQERAKNRWGDVVCVRCGLPKSIWANTAKGVCSWCSEPLGPEPGT